MSTQRDKARLDAGAAAIRRAEQEKAAGAALISPTIKLSDNELAPTGDIKRLLRAKVKFLPDHIGLVLSNGTTMTENLQILDWTIQLGEHVQFWIGDVINAGHCAYGSKYTEALKRTGRAKSTLKHYASVARRIPVARRKAALSFSHHLEILSRADADTIDGLLSDAAARAEQGQAPTVKELRGKGEPQPPDEQPDAGRVEGSADMSTETQLGPPPESEPVPEPVFELPDDLPELPHRATGKGLAIGFVDRGSADT